MRGCEMSSVLLLLLTLLFFIFQLFRKNYSSPSLPPGPGWRLPLLGHFPYLSKSKPFRQIDNWSKKFGDVMTIYFGMDPVIVISRYAAQREAFLSQGANFAGRPSLFVHESCWGRGLVIRDLHGSNILRSFLLSAIRQNRGEFSVQSLVSRETDILVERLAQRIREAEDSPAHSGDGSAPFASSAIEDDVFFVVGNVLQQLAFGRRHPHGSVEFKESAEWLKTTMELMERTAMITFLPWMRWIPYFRYFNMKKKAAEVHAMMLADVEGRRKTGEYRDESKMDLVSIFMRKIDQVREEKLLESQTNEGEEKDEEESESELFTESMLVMVMTELFFAAIQTECNTFGWAFLFLSTHPEIQEYTREHIWNAVGREGEITQDTRASLPFLEAVIAETQRSSNIAPFSMFHQNREEAVVGGYRIPANSIIMMNLFSTLTDPENFPDPEEFRPGRFMSEDGSSLCAAKLRLSVPYGVGPRICMGEAIARCELFTVIGRLLQRFRFSLIEGENYSLEKEMVLTIHPKPYRLRIQFA